ncbi:30S ribosomal protein S20 [Mucisphaera calidilacus]|uniref:Small ribosomal subunit protein bS20 n=1 Tax=Mucisphaera calidilacus TaxID=2527982 RepID=A0A518BW43_9BACT|nr:30S ribosomal protein S20 [Mucisphaera calidilacus]QDU71202.1 30S ribosomal protein S20 [Mucisphaera calidilacus]
MAHSLSAQKRVRQNIKRRALNRWRKRDLHDALVEYDEAILHASVEDAQKQLTDLYKLIDRTAAKGVIHRKTADRKKSRLAARLNAKAATA